MRIQRIILLFALCVCVSAVHAESDDLCMDGMLLFQEDFGGNDPEDPRVGQTHAEYIGRDDIGSLVGHRVIQEENFFKSSARTYEATYIKNKECRNGR